MKEWIGAWVRRERERGVEMDDPVNTRLYTLTHTHTPTHTHTHTLELMYTVSSKHRNARRVVV
jgi:hypothetical protein